MALQCSKVAAYAQATYEFTEQLALTAALPWMEDKTKVSFRKAMSAFLRQPIGLIIPMSAASRVFPIQA